MQRRGWRCRIGRGCGVAGFLNGTNYLVVLNAIIVIHFLISSEVFDKDSFMFFLSVGGVCYVGETGETKIIYTLNFMKCSFWQDANMAHVSDRYSGTGKAEEIKSLDRRTPSNAPEHLP